MENTNPINTGCRIGRVRMKRPENLVFFNGLTVVPHEPARILQYALEEGLKTVVIAGWDKDDKLYLSGSISSRAEVSWLLEKSQRYLLD